MDSLQDESLRALAEFFFDQHCVDFIHTNKTIRGPFQASIYHHEKDDFLLEEKWLCLDPFDVL